MKRLLASSLVLCLAAATGLSLRRRPTVPAPSMGKTAARVTTTRACCASIRCSIRGLRHRTTALEFAALLPASDLRPRRWLQRRRTTMATTAP